MRVPKINDFKKPVCQVWNFSKDPARQGQSVREAHHKAVEKLSPLLGTPASWKALRLDDLCKGYKKEACKGGCPEALTCIAISLSWQQGLLIVQGLGFFATRFSSSVEQQSPKLSPPYKGRATFKGKLKKERIGELHRFGWDERFSGHDPSPTVQNKLQTRRCNSVEMVALDVN